MCNKQVKYELWVRENISELDTLFCRAKIHLKWLKQSHFNLFCSFLFSNVANFYRVSGLPS